MNEFEKKGYLAGNFRVFHLSDTNQQVFSYHYHEFDKVLIFIKGDVDYVIEGKSYELHPYDIVLVNHNEIHRPVVKSRKPYERIIVYMAPDFLESYQTENYDLSQCLKTARKLHSNVLRVRSGHNHILFQSIINLEQACEKNEYANELYCRILFIAFMIQLNRVAIGSHLEYLHTNSCNEKVICLLQYINNHLTEDLNIDKLAETIYLSRYHMMRLFKQETGYTLSAYINEKRLLYARELLQSGMPVTQACFECGFKSYSAFSRAYKKLYDKMPKDMARRD